MASSMHSWTVSMLWQVVWRFRNPCFLDKVQLKLHRRRCMKTTNQNNCWMLAKRSVNCLVYCFVICWMVPTYTKNLWTINIPKSMFNTANTSSCSSCSPGSSASSSPYSLSSSSSKPSGLWISLSKLKSKFQLKSYLKFKPLFHQVSAQVLDPLKVRLLDCLIINGWD